MKVKWSSDVLLNLVQAQRHAGEEWAFFRELANGTGIQAGRWIDGYALHLWPSKKFRSVAYEVKVSRTDFMRELEDPTKRGAAEKVAGECWFLTPAGLVRPDEVPENWGLVVAAEDGQLRTLKMPRQGETPMPSMVFFAAVARRSCDPRMDPIVATLLGQELTFSRLQRLVEKASSGARRARGVATFGADLDDASHKDDRRTRTRWIEGELQRVLGWGATASREVLRERLEGHQQRRPDAVVIDEHALHAAREAVMKMARALGMRGFVSAHVGQDLETLAPLPVPPPQVPTQLGLALPDGAADG